MSQEPSLAGSAPSTEFTFAVFCWAGIDSASSCQLVFDISLQGQRQERSGWDKHEARSVPDMKVLRSTLQRRCSVSRGQSSSIRAVDGLVLPAVRQALGSARMRGLECCLAGQVVGRCSCASCSSWKQAVLASLQMLFRTLCIFIYYILKATTLSPCFCDSNRRTSGSLETSGGCLWGCVIWC